MTRLTPTRLSAAAVLAALLASGAAADLDTPSAPPPVLREPGNGGYTVPLRGLAAGTVEYSHGDPSDDEQLFLELMNRARLDPQGEGDRILDDYDDPDVKSAVNFFLKERPGVEFTRNENHDAFTALSPLPPLAFNGLLGEAANKHSIIMRIVDLQVHQVTGEPALRDRVEDEGYDAAGLSESIYVSAKSMLHAHAGFAIDWGQGDIDPDTGRPETGHRDALMSSEFVECGIGVIEDTDPDTFVGPQLITIDFAVPSDFSTRFVTGVVYEDRNGNELYDPGEGLSGVRIETDVSEFFTLTSSSGGYALPVPANAGDVMVFAAGEPGTAGEVVGSQHALVNLSGANVKVDFGPLPEPPLPGVVSLDGGTQIPIADGGTTDATIDVGELDPDSATIGDIDLFLALDHDDRSEARLTLVSPSGTEVLLFDGAPGGRDLRGEFDTTLRPVEPLAAFVGEPYAGTWTLRVEDAAGGVDTAVLERWTLRIRPGWVRTLHGAATPLAVTSLKVKDSPTPGKDKVVLKAEIDTGAGGINAEVAGGLRLLDPTTGDELLSVAIPALFDEQPPGGPVVKARLDFLRNGSSRTSVALKVSGIDLAGPLPATTRVELTVGATIVADDVRVSSGKSTGVAGRRFFVDAISSKEKNGSRSTVVKGRFAPDGAGSYTEGTAELALGDARFTLDASDLQVKGTKLVYKSGAGLRKLTVDTLKGTYAAKVDGAYELVVDGTTPVMLRLGDGFYGATRVRPYTKGTKTLY